MRTLHAHHIELFLITLLNIGDNINCTLKAYLWYFRWKLKLYTCKRPRIYSLEPRTFASVRYKTSQALRTRAPPTIGEYRQNHNVSVIAEQRRLQNLSKGHVHYELD